MKNYALKTPMDKNQLDTLTDALVNAMRYNDPSVMYPNVEAAKPNDGVEWNGGNLYFNQWDYTMEITYEHP